MDPKDRLIVALDVDTEEKAVRLAEKLKNDVKFFKIGFELFSSCGPSIVGRIREMDCEVFLDLKFHDIPNTVAKAAASVTRLGVFIFNVHTLGGYEMMKETSDIAAIEAKKLGIEKPKIIGVTILTSMDAKALKRVGIDGKVDDAVLRLASLAKDSGLDGVVASAEEAGLIRKKFGEGFLIVTPGVRPQGVSVGDQKRVVTPKFAVKAGADFIVVGRPITEAKDAAYAAREILKEMET